MFISSIYGEFTSDAMSRHKKSSKAPVVEQARKAHSGSPHDRFFKVIYSSPRNALDIFKIILPKSAFIKCDWKKLKAEKETFKDRQADLVFSVPLKNKPKSKIKIFILLEHKSYYSKTLFKQILDYQNAIYQRDKSGNIVSVVPIVFYHGRKPWSWKTSFKEGHSGKYFSDMPVFFQENMLNYNLVVFDTNDSKIKPYFKDKRIKSRGAFNVLQKIWSLKETAPELLELVSLFLSGFSEREKKDLTIGLFDYLHRAGRVSFNLLKKVEKQAINLRLLKKGGYMNFTDEIKKEAKLEGWQKGRQEEKRQLILKMLQKEVDISLISEVTELSKKEIQKLKNSS